MGRTIPKTRRGRLSGYTAAVSGVLTVGVGALIGSQLTDTSPAWMFALLLAGAASLWLLAAVFMWRVSEAASDSDPPDSAFGKIWNRLRLIRQDSQLRRFLSVRGLLISTALAAPYYLAYVQGMDDAVEQITSFKEGVST
jgi:MFS family permease